MLNIGRKFKLVVIAVVVVAGILLFPNWYGAGRPLASDIDSVLNENSLADLTNQQRINSGLIPYKRNNLLDLAARKKINDMVAYGYWAHFSPTGKSPWLFITASGYKYKYAGENLAKNVNSSSDAVNLWMASESHRKNILSKNYKEVGYAVYRGNYMGRNTTLVVQMFGSR